MMATILNSSILNSAILDFSHFAQNSDSNYFNLTQTHSFSLNLMMAAILNSAMLDSDTAILDSDTLLSSLRFTQKHSPSTLTLTQTDSIWLTWWSANLNLPSSQIAPKETSLMILTQLDDGNHLELCHLEFCHLGFSHLSHIHSKTLPSTLTLTQTNSIWLTWWWQPSWILPCWILPFAQKKLHSCILTQIDDGSHLEFCYLGFSHFAQKSSLVHSDSTWWWQPSWNLPSWIQSFCTKKSSLMHSDST